MGQLAKPLSTQGTTENLEKKRLRDTSCPWWLRDSGTRSTCPPDTYLRYCPFPRLKILLQSRNRLPPKTPKSQIFQKILGSQFSVRPVKPRNEGFSGNWEPRTGFSPSTGMHLVGPVLNAQARGSQIPVPWHPCSTVGYRTSGSAERWSPPRPPPATCCGCEFC